MVQNTLISIIEKIGVVTQNIFGWMLGAMALVVGYLGDSAMAFAGVGIAIVMDAVWGIIVAVKSKKFILSLLLRETMNKMFIYGTTLAMVLFIERSLNEDWYIATRVVCAIASACELWSICANILIIKPNFPFVKLFRKYLVGEIAKKVGISEEEFTNEVKNPIDY